jgi:ParB/RepB/Spo0J family partition protein
MRPRDPWREPRNITELLEDLDAGATLRQVLQAGHPVFSITWPDDPPDAPARMYLGALAAIVIGAERRGLIQRKSHQHAYERTETGRATVERAAARRARRRADAIPPYSLPTTEGPPTMTTAVQQIAITDLKLSATAAQMARRSMFDENALTSLATSIEEIGILQPLVARRVNGHFELVAGERRLLAAKKVGLTEVPVSVRELTDEQVLEVQLIENLQRADVHPMHEAEGYEALHRLGRSVEEIADRVGKSKAYVYARMKLLDLLPPARKAYYAGKLNASTALYIARVPKGLQQKAVKEITEFRGGEGMSARQALEHIQDEYMLVLKGAAFDPADATLLPAAGACGPCPKRTGNNPGLFGDVSNADVCTDVLCFREKVKAHGERLIGQARERGQKVIEGKQAAKLKDYGNSVAGHVKLDDRNYSDPKNRTWRQILGKEFVPTLFVDPKGGEVLEVVPRDELPAPKKVAGAAADPYKAKQREQARKTELEQRYRRELFQKVRKASVARETYHLREVELQEAALQLFEDLSHDGKRLTFKALGWEATKSKHHHGGMFELPMDVSELRGLELAQFIRDMVLARELHFWSYSSSKPESLEAAADELGVDAKAIRKALEGEQREKTQAAAKARRKAQAKAKAKAAPAKKAKRARKAA